MFMFVLKNCFCYYYSFVMIFNYFVFIENFFVVNVWVLFMMKIKGCLFYECMKWDNK